MTNNMYQTTQSMNAINLNVVIRGSFDWICI